MKKILLISFIAIVAIVLLSGCTQPANNTPAPSAPGTDTTPATNNEVGTPTDSGNTAAPASGNSFDEFIGLFGKKPTYTAMYDVVNSGMGTSSQGTYTIYSKDPSQRYDMQLSGMESKTWVLPEKTIMCTKPMSSMPETCIVQANTQSPKVNVDEMKQNPSKYTVTPLGPRTIAGETGNCYSVIFLLETGNANSEYCGTIDGILLYSKVTTSGITMEMTANQLSRNVDETMLIPPEVEENMWTNPQPI